MIRAILDTNVLASGITGLHLPTSTPGELLRRWRREHYHLIVSDHLLDELRRTLANPYFAQRISTEQTAQLLRMLRRRAEVTAITTTISGVATHPEDDLVLAAALSARATHLVTGDRHLQALARVESTAIVDPRTFLHLTDRALTPPPD